MGRLLEVDLRKHLPEVFDFVSVHLGCLPHFTGPSLFFLFCTTVVIYSTPSFMHYLQTSTSALSALP